jgi:transcriptional regulator with XRE-family HTH domain
MSIPAYAEHLRAAREKSGKSVEELASALGISSAAYHDLETFDDEILDSLSFRQLALLGEELNLNLRNFFAAGSTADSGESNFDDLAARIKEHVERHHMSVSEFEDKAGWEVEKHLEDPKEFWEYNAAALIDISNEIGMDWASLLPREGP